MNRLNLDFKLEGRQERLQYLRDYLDVIRFRPTEDELDMMAKYILWGKDEKTGLTAHKEGIELETRYKTWSPRTVESLDALIEEPGFSETLFRKPTDPPTRITRETFSRTSARQNAPSYLLPTFEKLWRQIDETELQLTFYEIQSGKRTAPIRQPLLDRFKESELNDLKARALSLHPYTYLKLKHRLVELRREQYTYRDLYSQPIISQPTFTFSDDSYPTFGTEISVLPVGIPSSKPLLQKIFREDRFPEPSDFSQEELKELSNLLWAPIPSTREFFDFRDENHLYQFYKIFDQLYDALDEVDEFSNLKDFLRAEQLYRKMADLSPILEDILNMKIRKKQNQEIANEVNRKYGKKYRSNYISTLYCKKCLASIARAASEHREVLENLFFEENFKKCKDCGRVLLMNESNFMRRARSNDGYSPRCKKCEKIKRNGGKINEEV